MTKRIETMKNRPCSPKHSFWTVFLVLHFTPVSTSIHRSVKFPKIILSYCILHWFDIFSEALKHYESERFLSPLSRSVICLLPVCQSKAYMSHGHILPMFFIWLLQWELLKKVHQTIFATTKVNLHQKFYSEMY